MSSRGATVPILVGASPGPCPSGSCSRKTWHLGSGFCLQPACCEAAALPPAPGLVTLVPVGAFSEAAAAGGGSGGALGEDTRSGGRAGAQSSTSTSPCPAEAKGRQGAAGSMGRDEVTLSLGCTRGSQEVAGVFPGVQQYLDSRPGLTQTLIAVGISSPFFPLFLWKANTGTWRRDV